MQLSLRFGFRTHNGLGHRMTPLGRYEPFPPASPFLQQIAITKKIVPRGGQRGHAIPGGLHILTIVPSAWGAYFIS
jgi:hypothetical protein